MSDTASQIRAWMNGVLTAKGWSAAQWAGAAGVAPSTIQRALKPSYAFVTSSRTLEKLASVAGVPPPVANDQVINLSQSQPRFLNVRYEAGAGVWREVGDVQAFDGTYPVSEEPAYSGFPQWLERIVGDSMDRDYPEGSLAHVVDAIAIGYAPRPGDHVVLARYRNGGQEMERTVKEVRITPKGPEFWPRSHNPRWNQPIQLFENGHDVADLHPVEVVGLVIGSYLPRRR